METYEKLKQLVEGISDDMDKFYNKGNKSAGTRIRKAMQEVKKVAQELRVDIQQNK